MVEKEMVYTANSKSATDALNLSLVAARDYCRWRGLQLPKEEELQAASAARAIVVLPFTEWTESGMSFGESYGHKQAKFLFARCVQR
jgi:hypothetical protein